MKHPISEYKTLVFDCDGVILNSNKVKTEAFYKTALPYGEESANKLVEYHVARGGVSRYKKFEWFVDNFVIENKSKILNNLLISYANHVREGLLGCEIVEGLKDLRMLTKGTNWLIVSGGDQNELREIFKIREISSLFDGGIFGSPDNKDTILEREIANGIISQPSLFFGDSEYDHVASNRAGLDFVFLNYWTEFKGWKEYCEENDIFVSSSIEAVQKGTVKQSKKHSLQV